MSLNRHQVWMLRIALGLKIWSGNIRCFLPHRLCSTHRLAGVGQGLTTSHFSCTKIIANIGSGLPASPLDKTHRSVASIVACANNSASSIFYFPYYPWPAHNGNPTSNMGYVHQPQPTHYKTNINHRLPTSTIVYQHRLVVVECGLLASPFSCKRMSEDIRGILHPINFVPHNSHTTLHVSSPITFILHNGQTTSDVAFKREHLACTQR